MRFVRICAILLLAAPAWIFPVCLPVAAQQERQGVSLDVGSPVEFVPREDDAVLEVDGLAVPGSVRVSKSAGDEGVDVSVIAGLDSYLLSLDPGSGISEEPALRAQAIVWRTQLVQLSESHDLDPTALLADQAGGDCAVDDCRRLSTKGPSAGWKEAVEDTRGLVLAKGRMLLPAPSHAASGGETEPGVWSEFGDEVRLVSVETPNEDVREEKWSRTLTVSEAEAALASLGLPPAATGEEPGNGSAGGSAPASSGLESLTYVGTDRGGEDAVQATLRGRTYTIKTPDLTRAVNATSASPDTGGPFLPSPRLESVTLDTSGGATVVRVEGRGEGHGLGLSRMEAEGLAAQRGWSEDEILERFYPGRSVTSLIDLPEDVTVMVLEGVPQVTVAGDEPFRISAAGQTVVAAALTDWSVRAGEVPSGRKAARSSLVLEGPEGATAPLAVTGFNAPLRVTDAGPVEVRFVLSKPAVVSLVVDGPAGARTVEIAEGEPLDSGAHSATVDFEAAGIYGVSVRAEAGDDVALSPTLSVDIDPIPAGPTFLQAVSAVLFSTVLVGLALWRRRVRLERKNPGDGNFSQMTRAELR